MKSQYASRVALIVVCAIWQAACGSGGSMGGDTQPPAPTLNSITVTAVSQAVMAGQTDQMTATGHYSDGSTKDLTGSAMWNSSDQDVATVDTSGKAKGVAAGSATISAASGTISGNTKLMVNQPFAVSVSPAMATVTAGGTQQFTATVTNGDGTTKVSWTATAGSFSSSSGTATTWIAPLSAATVTITAMATDQDQSANGIAQVTVTVPQITSVNPWALYIENFRTVVANIAINGEGFSSTGWWDLEPDEAINLQDQFAYVDPSRVNMSLIFGNGGPLPNGWSPGWITVYGCSDNNAPPCSNHEYVAFWQDQNLLAVGANQFFFVDSEVGTDKYNNADGSSAGQLYINEISNNPISGDSIAVDNTTNDVLFGFVWDGFGGAVRWLDANGNSYSGADDHNNGGGVRSVAARNGIGAAAEPNRPTVMFFDLSQVNPPVAYPANGQTPGQAPWAVDMSDGCTGASTSAFVYDREGVTLYRYDVAASGGTVQVTANGSYSLDQATFATPASKLTSASASILGGYYAQAFNQGSPRACVVGVVAPHLNSDNSITFNVAFVDGNRMERIGDPIALPGFVVRTAKDDTHGLVLMGYLPSQEPQTPLTQYLGVDPVGGIQLRSETSILLPVGLGVSPDGMQFYVCQREACEVRSNQ